jgi:hypothetical protein
MGWTGGSSGPVVRMKAASWSVECSGSEPTGDRGTYLVGTGGGLLVDVVFVFRMIGVEGMLRTPAGLGDLLS